MDLRLHWLHCHGAQKLFLVYWDKGPNNWGDYHTEKQPPVYHKSKRPLFAGCAQILLHVLQAQLKCTK